MIQTVNINVAALPALRGPGSFMVLSQNENGRQIRFRILGSDLPTGCTATFSGTKPDGNVYSTTGTVSGNFVIVQEDIQMTAVAGIWDAKLEIAKGTENIVTSIIRVTVVRDPVAGDAIPSDSQLDGIVTEVKYYAEHARSEAYGSPLTASTKSAMTDKTRVYVYTGSESGMTAGNWYYWNGSAWTSGGVYNAVAVQTDATLSVAGKAADGKATGDAIEELKEDLNADLGVIYTSENLTSSLTSGGYILLSGGVGSIVSDTPVSNASYSWIKIPVKHGDRIVFSCKGGGNPRAWAVTDEDRKILAVADANVTVENYSLTIVQIGYVYINNNSPFTASVIHKINELDYYNSIVDSYKGKTISKTIATANTTYAVAYDFLKGQTVKLENNTSGAMSVNLYEADGTSHAIAGNLTAGDYITFVVEYNNCIQIGGFCGGTGSVVLTIVDINSAVDEKIEVVNTKVEAVNAKVDESIYIDITKTLQTLSWTDGYYIDSSGSPVSATNYRYSELISVSEGSEIQYDLTNANAVAVTICAYDSSETFQLSKSIWKDTSQTTGTLVRFTGTYTVPSDIKFVRICHQIADQSQSVSVPTLEDAVLKNIEDIAKIKEELETFDVLNQWKNKKWVAFGTSITDNYSSGSYITYGDHEGEHTGKYVPYLLEMSELSQSSFVNRGIAGGSINGHILYYIRYYTTDQANADLVTIEGAVNDFASAIPLGQVGDTVPYTHNLLPDGTSEGSFSGACYQAFTTALTNAPNAVIVLLTETTGKGTNQANYDQLHKNSLGLYQSDYIDMTMKVAEFVGIPVINCGRDSMINAQNPQYIADHIHHTYLGGYQYARAIWAKLKGIPLKALTTPE